MTNPTPAQTGTERPEGSAAPAEFPIIGWRSPWMWSFLIGAFTLTMLRPCMRYIPEPPPVVAELPAFTLTAADGQAFTRADLEGGTTVVALVCASCGASDARRLEQLRELTESFEGADWPVRIWAMGVDPERDTPATMTQLQERLLPESSSWWLTSGEPAEVERLLEVFAQAEHGPAWEGETWRAAGHDAFGLIDRRGALRGFFVVTASHGVDEVRHRAVHVIREEE